MISVWLNKACLFLLILLIFVPFEIYHIGTLAWFSLVWSLISATMLFLKNNNVHNDFIQRKISTTSHAAQAQQNSTKDDFFAKVIASLKTFALWLKLHTEFTVAPLCKVMPSILFRIFSYYIIMSYLSDFYRGIGLALPLIVFSSIVLLGFLAGKVCIGIKDEEALVNSFCCIVFPIYLDIFSVVSINLKCCHEIKVTTFQ